jgi:hypothetical protein
MVVARFAFFRCRWSFLAKDEALNVVNWWRRVTLVDPVVVVVIVVVVVVVVDDDDDDCIDEDCRWPGFRIP